MGAEWNLEGSRKPTLSFVEQKENTESNYLQPQDGKNSIQMTRLCTDALIVPLLTRLTYPATVWLTKWNGSITLKLNQHDLIRHSRLVLLVGTGCQNLSLPPEKYVSPYSNHKTLLFFALSR
jgi:hypothetical protein